MGLSARARRRPSASHSSRGAWSGRHTAGRRLHGKERDLRQHRGARPGDRARGVSAGRRERGLGDRSRAVGRSRADAALRHAHGAARCDVQVGAAARAPWHRCAGARGRRRRPRQNHRLDRVGAVRLAHPRLLPDEPDRARIRRHGRDERFEEDRERLTAPQGRRVREHARNHEQLSADLVGLRPLVRRHGGMERVHARRAACHHRLPPAHGPQGVGGRADAARAERGRAIWALPVVRRPPQVRFQGADHPGRRQQGRIPAGAARDRHLCACRLGRDPRQRKRARQVGDLRPQRRRPLSLGPVVTCRLRHHHGRLGVELEVPVHGLAAVRRADGLLRGLDRLRDHHGHPLRRLAQPDRHRQRTAFRARYARRSSELARRLVLAAAAPDVRDLLRLRARRDQPPPLRPRGGGIGARRRLHGRILLDTLSLVHAGRVRGDRHHVRHDDDPVPRRLAAAGRGRAVHLGAGCPLVPGEVRFRLLPVRHGEGDRAALPLRPAHAARLEGVPAAVARHGRHRGGGGEIRIEVISAWQRASRDP